MYKWQQVRALNEKGISKKEISRRLKMSINTVRKYIRTDNPPEFNPRTYQSKVLAYDKEVKSMLSKGYIGTRIFAELLKLGFDGSQTGVYRYIQGLNNHEKLKNLSTTRVESPPGKQMQYDWKEWELLVGGQTKKIYIHGLVLSNSRYKYYSFSLSIKTPDIIRSIFQGMEYFSGYASELVMDNAKQMVITHSKEGIVRYNDEFLKFCGLFGIDPSACKNYRARTKGKVERPFYYLQEHFLRGLEVNSFQELEQELINFTEKYNSRIHTSLRESPNERYWKEIEHLKEIPKVEPSMFFSREIRKVSNDGYVSFQGSHYPVPLKKAFQNVFVEVILGYQIRIYDQDTRVIAEHEINLEKQRLLHPEHEKLNQIFLLRKENTRSSLVKNFKESFPEIGEKFFIGARQEHTANVYWHISAIMEYLNFYPVEDVRTALEKCLNSGCFHKNYVRDFLSKKQLKQIEPMAFKTNAFTSVNIKRSLSEYGGIQ